MDGVEASIRGAYGLSEDFVMTINSHRIIDKNGYTSHQFYFTFAEREAKKKPRSQKAPSRQERDRKRLLLHMAKQKRNSDEAAREASRFLKSSGYPAGAPLLDSRGNLSIPLGKDAVVSTGNTTAASVESKSSSSSSSSSAVKHSSGKPSLPAVPEMDDIEEYSDVALPAGFSALDHACFIDDFHVVLKRGNIMVAHPPFNSWSTALQQAYAAKLGDGQVMKKHDHLGCTASISAIGMEKQLCSSLLQAMRSHELRAK